MEEAGFGYQLRPRCIASKAIPSKAPIHGFLVSGSSCCTLGIPRDASWGRLTQHSGQSRRTQRASNVKTIWGPVCIRRKMRAHFGTLETQMPTLFREVTPLPASGADFLFLYELGVLARVQEDWLEQKPQRVQYLQSCDRMIVQHDHAIH